MATRTCTACGQRLREGWIRCPRCRQLLPEFAGEPVPPPSVWDHPLTRPVLMTAACIVLAGGVAFGLRAASRAVTDTTVERSAAAGVIDLSALTAPESTTAPAPRPVDLQLQLQNAEREKLREGGAAYANGDMATALARYQTAVADAPNDPEAHNKLGQVLVRQNRTLEALPHFDAAVRLDASRWAYRFNRARAYEQLNRLDEAVAEYRAAAELFPEDYATQYNLGLTLMKMKQYEDSARALERAVTLAPGEASFLITLGTAYVGADHLDRAKAVFQQFLELAPDDADAPRVRSLLSSLETGE